MGIFNKGDQFFSNFTISIFFGFKEDLFFIDGGFLILDSFNLGFNISDFMSLLAFFLSGVQVIEFFTFLDFSFNQFNLDTGGFFGDSSFSGSFNGFSGTVGIFSYVQSGLLSGIGFSDRDHGFSGDFDGVSRVLQVLFSLLFSHGFFGQVDIFFSEFTESKSSIIGFSMDN